jgi:hypothetical protein
VNTGAGNPATADKTSFGSFTAGVDGIIGQQMHAVFVLHRETGFLVGCEFCEADGVEFAESEKPLNAVFTETTVVVVHEPWGGHVLIL